jgi:hypothetical protein
MRPVVSALVGLVLVAGAAQGTARAQPPAANRSAVEKDLIGRARAIEAFAEGRSTALLPGGRLGRHPRNTA